ncbi:MAG: hypothetical protein ABIO44_02625 [Saprospiraceae bacterium]
MKRMWIRYLSVISFLLSLTSCYKNSFESPIIESPNPKTNHWKKVYGQILNYNNSPIAFAKVIFKSKIVETNEHGYFQFEDFISEDRSIIKIQHPQYIDGIVNIKAFTEGNQRVICHLLFKNSSNRYSSSDKISINSIHGFKIHFEENSFNNEDSTKYSGELRFNYNLLELSSTIFDNIPNDHFAIKDKEQNLVLPQMPVIFLEVKTLNGENLILNKEANIEIEIPNNLINGSNANIDIWYLDEKDGVWKNKFTATKSNNIYFGKIEKLGFVKIEEGKKQITLSGRFIGFDQLPALNLQFFSSLSFDQVQLNDAGFYSIKVLANINYNQELFNLQNQSLYASQLNVKDLDMTLDNLSLDNSDNVYIKAKVEDCNNSTNANNWIILRESDQLIDQKLLPDQNGLILEIIKSSNLSNFVLFSGSARPYIINKADPIYLNSHKNILGDIEVCGSDEGQSEMEIMNSNNFLLGLHYFPKNTYQFIGKDEKNGILDLEWIDIFSENDQITYLISLRIENGQASILSNRIDSYVKGNPSIRFTFQNLQMAKINIINKFNNSNSTIIDISDLQVIDQEGQTYHMNFKGLYLK